MDIVIRVDKLTGSYNWHDSHTLVDDCIQVRQVLGLGECYRVVQRWERRMDFRYQLLEFILIVEKQK